MNAALELPKSVGDFLRAEPEWLRGWMARRQVGLFSYCIAAIVLGAGSYGLVMGWWRNPQQALYTGLKLPLVILLTTAGNGLINGMLAPLLGLNVTFRQAFASVLLSFAVTSIVLGALSPVALFIVWNTPPLNAGTRLISPEYGFLQLTLTICVAIAGVAGNVRLFPLLRHWSGNFAIARNVLLAWLIVNLFLGSQISWVLRPFIWDVDRPVEFIGPGSFQGSFFETVFNALCRLMF